MNIRWILLIFLSALLLASCSPKKGIEPIESLAPPSQKILPTASAISSPQSDTTEIGLSTPLPDDLQTLTEKVREDLAKRLSISKFTINFVTALEITWPDSSLGCPQPGVMYTQALVSGYLMILEVDGKKYDYHVIDGENFILCEGVSPRVSPINTPSSLLIRDFSEQGMAAAAANDLVSRLGFPIGEIEVVATERTEVPAATPCGNTTVKDETGPLQEGLTLGYEILLQYRDTQYRYMISGTILYFCGEQA